MRLNGVCVWRCVLFREFYSFFLLWFWFFLSLECAYFGIFKVNVRIVCSLCVCVMVWSSKPIVAVNNADYYIV